MLQRLFPKIKPNSPFSHFRSSHSLNERSKVSNAIKEKHPERIPIIVEPSLGNDVPLIERSKFLVPKDITFGAFIFEIRKHIKGLKPDQAIFVFINNTLPSAATQISQLYNIHSDPDGFMYITYCIENTFG